MKTREQNLVGKRLAGGDGEELGTVTRIVHAEHSDAPEWLVVRFGLFGMRERLVPYAGARTSEEEIVVPLEREAIRTSPEIDLEKGLTTADEEALVRHYRRGPHGTLGGTMNETGTVAKDEVELTRYEERLSLNKRVEEHGRVRIRRLVEQEEQDQTVAVTTDDFEVIREPITNGRIEPHRMAEGEQELILYRERLVVTKVAVPVERVVLRRKKAERKQTVRETIARERIEVEKLDIPPQPGAVPPRAE